MKKTATELEGVFILEPAIYEDARGYFTETYNADVFEKLGLSLEFVQDNQSLSKEVGTIRGLHYQLKEKAQTKVVRCLAGAIYDVAVDIRKGSPTFGQWVGVLLSEKNMRQLVVPRGFAHGFCTLEPDTVVAYKVDNLYSPAHDRGIRFDDSNIGVVWPAAAAALSEKDRQLPTLAQAEIDFVYGEAQK